jgi:Flp pilus assembly protein TadD
MAKKCFGLVLCLLAFSVGFQPAHAGLFDKAPPPAPPAGASDDAIMQIQKAFDDQRYLDASKLLNQTLISSGTDSRLTYWAGQLSLTRGRYQDALTNFTVVKADPRMKARALEGEGIALIKLGRSGEAMAALQAAVAEDPRAWRAWNALGSEFDRRHDWTRAEEAYGHAISGSDGSAIAYNNRGYSRLSQNRPDIAIPDFVAALEKKPDMAPARNNLRLAMSMQGEYDRAVKGVGAADQAAVLNNAGFAAMLRGDYEKAKELLTEAMDAKKGYYALAAANLAATQSLAKESAKD